LDQNLQDATTAVAAYLRENVKAEVISPEEAYHSRAILLNCPPVSVLEPCHQLNG
jgi:hypothetical protein